MEADWEFEIGGDAPVIEAYWSGFVDLRSEPERASELSECGELPGLADALIKLNAAGSPVWTSKVDVFAPDCIDPDEMGALPAEAGHAIACYIDLLPRGEEVWRLPAGAERSCKQICARLRAVQLGGCRVDIVVRRAIVGDVDGLAATAYLTACGAEPDEAKTRLMQCLDTFAEVVAST